MRIVTLENSGRSTLRKVYLVLGDRSRLEDVNTLVDVGQDPAILASLERASTGVGKWPVEQVVLTHGHSDHCALLPQIRAVFHPKVLAFSPNIYGVDGCCVMGRRSKWATGISRSSTRRVTAATRSAFTTSRRACSSLATLRPDRSPDGTYEAGFLAALERSAPAM